MTPVKVEEAVPAMVSSNPLRLTTPGLMEVVVEFVPAKAPIEELEASSSVTPATLFNVKAAPDAVPVAE